MRAEPKRPKGLERLANGGVSTLGGLARALVVSEDAMRIRLGLAKDELPPALSMSVAAQPAETVGLEPVIAAQSPAPVGDETGTWTVAIGDGR